MSFPRYPKHKDSGVEWLGQVPEHWPLPPLYLRYELVLGKMLDTKKLTGEHSLPYVRNVDVQWDHVNISDLHELDITPDEVGRFTLRKGDVLVCEGGEVGRTALWRGQLNHCAFQKAIHRLRPLTSSEEPRFFFHCMRFASATNIFIADGNPNTIPHLTGEKFRLYRFPTPPKQEQSDIAAFLDRETAKIEALVAVQRRLMELLKEKRQAVISHAVTKGLNPNAPMKPSGIEWLGDVPAHWEVTQLRRLLAVHLSNGVFKKKEEFGSGVLLINVFDIYRSDFKVDFASLDRVQCDPSETSNYEVLSGDLFFVRSSLKEEGIAVVAMADSHSEPVVYECHLIRARPNRQVLNGRFGSYVFNSAVYRSIMVAKAKVTTMTTIDQEAILSTQMPIPPISEQTHIAEFLARETTKFDTLTTEAQYAIDLLQERRTALISAAVTGKIDVRGLVSAKAEAA